MLSRDLLHHARRRPSCSRHKQITSHSPYRRGSVEFEPVRDQVHPRILQAKVRSLAQAVRHTRGSRRASLDGDFLRRLLRHIIGRDFSRLGVSPHSAPREPLPSSASVLRASSVVKLIAQVRVGKTLSEEGTPSARHASRRRLAEGLECHASRCSRLFGPIVDCGPGVRREKPGLRDAR